MSCQWVLTVRWFWQSLISLRSPWEQTYSLQQEEKPQHLGKWLEFKVFLNQSPSGFDIAGLVISKVNLFLVDEVLERTVSIPVSLTANLLFQYPSLLRGV